MRRTPPTHEALLAILRDRGPLTHFDIAEKAGCSWRAAYDVLHDLEREGVVRIQSDARAPGERRKRGTLVYSLTPGA